MSPSASSRSVGLARSVKLPKLTPATPPAGEGELAEAFVRHSPSRMRAVSFDRAIPDP